MGRRRRGIQPKVRLRPLTRAEQRVLRGKLPTPAMVSASMS